MSIIGNFTRRSMKVHRKWTVVTILGVVIATAMISAVSTFTSSFLDLMRRDTIADGGNWHAILSDVKAGDVKTVRNASFVDSVSLSRDLGYALLDGSTNPDKPYLFLKQYDAQSQKNYPIKLLEGRMPKTAQEIVVSQHIETNGGVKLRLGETLTLQLGHRLPAGDQPEELDQSTPFQGEERKGADGTLAGERFEPTSTARFTVAGIMERPSFERSWSPGYTAFTNLDAAALGPNETVNAALLVKKLNRGIFSDVAALAKQVGLPDERVSFNNELLRYSGVFQADNLQSTLYGFLAVIIGIILIASVSLIYNAFSISVSERTRQLGMLASVGATRAQKRRSVYLEGLYIGLIGIPAGVLLGIAGIGVTLEGIRPLMATFLNSSTGGLRLSVSPASVVLAAALAALTIFVSAWRPARRASRIMPIDAIRQAQEIRLTARAVRTSRLSRFLFGFEGELALKNLKRSRKKYRATVASLAVSLVLFLTASYYPAFTEAANSAARDTQNYDVLVSSFHDSDPNRTEQAFQRIASFDTVTRSARMSSNGRGLFALDAAQTTDLFRRIQTPGPDGIYLPTAMVCGYDRASFEAFARSIGADPAPMERTESLSGILINASRGQKDGKYIAGTPLFAEPGDTLHYAVLEEKTSQSRHLLDFTIGAATDALPMGLKRLPFSALQIVVCENVFDAFQARLPEELRSNEMGLILKTNDDQKLEAQIEEMPIQQLFVANLVGNARKQRNLDLVFEVFLFGFIALISLICIANMFNTITTNVALRRREFAMLRSVGMTPKGFGRMIRYESLFYGLKALLWGLPVSFGIGVLLNRVASSSIEGGFVFPWQYYLAAVAVLFVIVASTMLYASAKIRRENIVDALTGEDL